MAKRVCGAVARLVAFQKTGSGFDGVWNDIGPIVDEFARRSLRKLGIGARTGDDEWAVNDVVQQTVACLMGLSAPTAQGRFDPAKAKPGISGLRGWLWRVVFNQGVEWSRTYRGGRGIKVFVESAFDCNELPSGDDPSSLLDRQPAKIERPDLLPILERCIAKLPDPFLQTLVRLKLQDGYSERQTAKALGVPVSRVHRRLQHAYALLRSMLDDEFDAPGLAM